MTDTRTCTKCGNSYPATEEHFRLRDWGLDSWCRKCNSTETLRRWREKHPRVIKPAICRHCGKPILLRSTRARSHDERENSECAKKEKARQRAVVKNYHRTVHQRAYKGARAKPEGVRKRCPFCGELMPAGYRFRCDACCRKIMAGADENTMFMVHNV